MSLGGLGIEAEGWIGCMYREGKKGKEQNAFGIFLCLSAKKGVVGDALGLAGKTLFPT